MENVTEKIRAEATKLLEKGEVDLVIGFREGSIPLTSRPWFARTPEQALELHWDGFCNLNLCNYLTKREERIAVVAKGCDSRSIVGHLKENQIKRDQLVIIGVPCRGMLDKEKLIEKAEGKEVLFRRRKRRTGRTYRERPFHVGRQGGRAPAMLLHLRSSKPGHPRRTDRGSRPGAK